MTTSSKRILVVGLLVVTGGSAAAAQQVDGGGEGPRFLLAAPASSGAPLPVDASRVTLLRRRVTVELSDAPLKQALSEIGRAAGVVFAYSPEALEGARRVRVRADELTLAAVLTEVLLDANVDVLVSGGARITLVPQERVLPVQNGMVIGWVTDAKTGDPLGGADVLLDRGRWRTTTRGDGMYQLTAVAPGSYELTVRRIGYTKQSQPVTVAEGAEVRIDVALAPVPTQLDEVVTTVTGEQRLRELGHVVGRINADSLVREAPVSTLSELLNGRVPGLQVFQGQGTVGGDVSLQIRTLNSLLLATEPIVMVDGVRYTSGRSEYTGPFNGETTSRLNDLNPNDIETIEVVKGPSAATLYGTDAANGVIVITTKRGRAGPAQWNAYARRAASAIPAQRFPDKWWGWGTESSNCTLRGVAEGSCTQDSISVLPNPLNDSELTILESKPRWEYGGSVSGGREDLRYYFSGDVERATGPIQMPPALVRQIEERRGVAELPEEQLEPNTVSKENLRANVTAALGEGLELHVNTGYSRGATRTITGSSYLNAMSQATPSQAYGPLGPEEHFALSATERLDRFFGSATGQWRAASWLQARATVALDLANTKRASLARRDESSQLASEGAAGDDRFRQVSTRAELGLTATARRGRLSARSAVGAEYVRSLGDGLASMGFGLPPGGESVSQAAFQLNMQFYNEAVALGGYFEETLGLNDRLFVTGALRVDGASAFGRDYEAAVYPKASVSWFLSEEPFVPRLPGLDELRLRYAFGASGQQATPTMALPTFHVGQTVLDGGPTNTIVLSGLGNPNLRPERVQEHEFGFDAAGLDGRVQLALTWFHRKAIDQIVARPLPAGFGSMHTNLGLTTARGFEAELGVRVLETRPVSWDLSLQHSLRRSKLVRLGDVRPLETGSGGYVEGYPLGARFAAPIVGYADANGNGIIETTEVQFGDPVYVGESTPPRSQTLTTVVGLFQRRLRLSALFERRSGFTQVNGLKQLQCLNGQCRAAVDPSTPLAEQATLASEEIGYMEPGDFTRLREVTAAFDLPPGLLQAVHLRSASLSLAVRNLALWTKFSGPDPESASVTGYRGGLAIGIPQGRSWTLRLDLGL